MFVVFNFDETFTTLVGMGGGGVGAGGATGGFHNSWIKIPWLVLWYHVTLSYIGVIW